jgi:hypothetical protein
MAMAKVVQTQVITHTLILHRDRNITGYIDGGGALYLYIGAAILILLPEMERQLCFLT